MMPINERYAEQDDIGAWADSHPVTLRHTAPQGRPEQGWPMRRCSPEMAAEPREAASACTEIGAEPEDQIEGADGVLLAYFAAVLLALFTAWCIANYLAASSV